jgi:hypothetical protein
MSLLIRESIRRESKPPPAGSHLAVCVWVIGLGTQDGRFGPKEQVLLGFELIGQSRRWHDKNGDEHESPVVVSRTFTMSLSPKSALRPLLECWRGKIFNDAELKGFDISNLAGKPCLVGITHNESGDRIYANVSSIMGTKEKPTAESTVLIYDADEHDREIFERLPQWIQQKINDRLRMEPAQKIRDEQPKEVEEFDDEIPF